MFTWLKKAWAKFESWVAVIAPGIKTVLVTSLGAIGSGAAALQEYVTGIPMHNFVSDTSYAIVVAVLFTLAFWLRGIGDRVKARVDATV